MRRRGRSESEFLIAASERSNELRHIGLALQAPESLSGFEDACGDPAYHHGPTAPAFQIPLHVTRATQDTFDPVGGEFLIVRKHSERSRVAVIRPNPASHPAPVRGPRAPVWEDRDDDSRPRRRARARAAGRHGLGRLAHVARPETPLSRVDLYGGALAAPLRLSHLRGNHRPRHRGV